MVDAENTKEGTFLELYPMDFFEAFVTILTIRAIMDKPIDYYYVIKTSTVLGLLLYLANLVSEEYKSNIREGLRNSIGYFIFTQFSA